MRYYNNRPASKVSLQSNLWTKIGASSMTILRKTTEMQSLSGQDFQHDKLGCELVKYFIVK